MIAYADPVAQAEIERLREQIADMAPRDWNGLMTILDEVYPTDVFPPGEDNPGADTGVRILSLIRHLDRLRARAAELERAGIGWKCRACGWIAADIETVKAALWPEGERTHAMVCPRCSAEGEFVDSDLIPDLAARVAELEAREQRVRRIHRPYMFVPDETYCLGCTTGSYPCPTIAALDGPQP